MRATPYTVAHKSHRFGTVLEITSLSSGRSIRAVVTDRGPFVPGRCVDLGRAGADALGIGGLGRVRVDPVP